METKITIKHFDIEASVALTEGADLNDLFNAFHGMSMIFGWHQLEWEKCIIRRAEQYKNIEE